MNIHSFTFNPFSENAYLIYDETKKCAIIDPGCYMPEEKQELLSFIKKNELSPVLLLNTHCHVDHVFGNKFVFDQFGLLPQFHKNELRLLEAAGEYSKQWGVFLEPSPLPEKFLDETDVIRFGNQEFTILLAPGHSPGSICFYHEKEKIIIAGDVLFQMSIGRFDLPGGDEKTLLNSIHEKLLPLPPDVKVYAGHGSPTTIGFEKMYNPFLT